MMNKECTLYIEEIHSDDGHENDNNKNDDHDEEVLESSLFEMNNESTSSSTYSDNRRSIRKDDTTLVVTKDTTKNEEEINGLSISDDDATKTNTNTIPSCPISIGGGSTITRIKQKLFVIGGCNRTGDPPSSAVHYYDFETNQWYCNVECKGNLTLGRFGHTAVALHSKIYTFGGQALITNNNTASSNTTLTSINSVHCLNTETMEWTEINTTATASTTNSTTTNELSSKSSIPKPRNSHSCVFSKRKECMVIFGGANEIVGPMNDVWLFHLKDGCYEWEELSCCGDDANNANTTATTKNTNDGKKNDIPVAREMHSACIDDDSNVIYVVGGRNVRGIVCQDVWALNLETKLWNKINDIPSPRCAHTANMLGSGNSSDSNNRLTMIIHGGWNGTNHIFHDFLVYDFQKKCWNIETMTCSGSSNKIVGRFGHASSSMDEDDNKEIYIFGGVNATSDLSDILIVRPK